MPKPAGLPARRALVLAHTHWDREWYHAAPRFRQRLVALIDALLLQPPDPAAPFLLDGQAIVLADYVSVRPDRAAEVARHLQAGALEAGPWYVLADNLIPSGEAIVRNLEAGRRWLARFGAAAPAVAYCPDAFGHPAAMPAIARGFGMEVAIAWRGVGGATGGVDDVVRWRAPDGSQIVLYHLPPDGYETGSALPATPAHAHERWRALLALLGRRAVTSMALVPAGADHHARQPDLPGALEAARVVATTIARDGGDAWTVERTTLAGFAAALTHAVGDTPAARITTVHGEQRDSYGYTWTLQGTFATRAQQKRRNARLERALLSDVEPWLALAWLHGGPRATRVSRSAALTLAQLPALLQHAWETLLRTHPHDTLCGCSIDAVARAMSGRQASVATQIAGLREASLSLALQHDPVQARGHGLAVPAPVVVRNRVAYARGGIARLTLVDTLHDEPVGPGSAAMPAPEARATPDARDALPSRAQLLHSRETVARRESPQHYPDNDRVRARTILAWVPPVPPFGLRVLGRADTDHTVSNHASPGVPTPATRVSADRDGWMLRNGVVTLRVTRAGVELIMGERILLDALALEWQRDEGDSYTASLRGKRTRLIMDRVRPGAAGPLRASVHVDWRLPSDAQSLAVRTTLSLDAGSNTLRCRVTGRNRANNHRLQLVWHTDVHTDAALADAAFGPVLRRPMSPRAGAAETPPDTMPLHRWLCHVDAERGATLITDGLAEGAAAPQRLAVTLLRAVGDLSRNDLPERPGHAGWPAATPLAQCRGRFRAEVGLLLHGPFERPVGAIVADDTAAPASHAITAPGDIALLDAIHRAADDLLLPLVGGTWRDLRTEVRERAGPSLEGAGLVASAVTVSDDGAALVLRAVNLSDVATVGTWIMPDGASLNDDNPDGAALGGVDAEHAWLVTRCRLDGTPTEPPVLSGARVPFSAAAREIVTLRLARAAR